MGSYSFSHEFYVSHIPRYPFVLGADFLSAHEANIQFQRDGSALLAFAGGKTALACSGITDIQLVSSTRFKHELEADKNLIVGAILINEHGDIVQREHEIQLAGQEVQAGADGDPETELLPSPVRITSISIEQQVSK